ncbi:hypothetical protein TNCV_664871 [Trichonephila clavipes]|nr:hypothetical protein TNCV_664871 [Trichonephila clavipes]
MYTCTPKYCGDLSSDIAPKLMIVRNITAGSHSCEPETPSVIRAVKKEPPDPNRVGWDSVENIEENGCVASDLTNNTYSEL